MKLSIIIPLFKLDDLTSKFIDNLNSLPQNNLEIIIVCSQQANSYILKQKNIFYLQKNNLTRAKALNYGALEASGQFLWFLHCDSVFNLDLFNSLLKNIDLYPDSLHCFYLKFSKNKMKITQINSFCANMRSLLLRIPFGDQGLAISKDNFHKINGYPEDVKYGEDHLFIWRAKQKNIKLKHIAKYLITSNQKYIDNGWLYNTIFNQFIWLQQASREFCKLLKNKIC